MFSPSELTEIKLFLALLFPWDEDGSKLYKTVSWTFVGREGTSTFANYAAQSMDDVIRLIETRYKRAAANVYIALGTQRMASMEIVSNDGYKKSIRKHSNVVSFNSIYLDIDVGKEGAYATTEDAFHALDDFCQQQGLPPPTMEVYSGTGGLHVYWCFDKPIPLANWTPLAAGLRNAARQYGLKNDPQVTVNPAGILRVPNTFNHKRTPPTKVKLYHEPGQTFPRYSYQQMRGALSNHMDRVEVRQGDAANHARTKNFTAGLDESSPPVSIEDVATNCLVIADILDRGGKGDKEPLWSQAIYAAAFTSDPVAAAHALSNQDPRYTAADTERKLQEKIAVRNSNSSAGWPTCESFSQHHPKCSQCYLFEKKKTPFHHARRNTPPPPPPGSVHGGSMQPHGSDPLMPAEYWRNRDNHVLTLAKNKAGDTYTVELINYPILDAGLDTEGDLLYLAEVGGRPLWRHIVVSTSMQPAQAASALAKGHGLYIPTKNHIHARDFLVAWVNHLQSIKRKAAESGYGWLVDGSGFAFDDKIFRPTHTDTVFRGKHSDPNFTQVGELKPWQDAMQLVYGNPPLETVVASAFAAPLCELVGSSSLVMSIYSAASGVGKTTAMSLGQAVWGHPRSGMSTLADTTNSMMKKISDLRSLPIYWDELRTKDQLEKVIDLVFQVTQGKAKARLNRDSSQMESGIFTTMFIVASNLGIADTVYSQTEATQAGGLRVMEIEADALKEAMPDYQARQLMRPIQQNYGVAGATYAQWLAVNKTQVEKLLKITAKDLQDRHDFTPKERFWAMTMATLIAGAGIANHIGVTRFDMTALSDYFDTVIARQRGELKAQEYATMDGADDVLSLLHEMMNDIRNKNLVVTETLPYGISGRPVPNNVVNTDTQRLEDVWMQVGDTDGRIRVRVRPFNTWLRKHRLSPKQIIGRLGTHYHVEQGKQGIGVGVAGLDHMAKYRTTCYDFTPLSDPHAPSPGSS